MKWGTEQESPGTSEEQVHFVHAVTKVLVLQDPAYRPQKSWYYMTLLTGQASPCTCRECMRVADVLN